MPSVLLPCLQYDEDYGHPNAATPPTPTPPVIMFRCQSNNFEPYARRINHTYHQQFLIRESTILRGLSRGRARTPVARMAITYTSTSAARKEEAREDLDSSSPPCTSAFASRVVKKGCGDKSPPILRRRSLRSWDGASGAHQHDALKQIEVHEGAKPCNRRANVKIDHGIHGVIAQVCSPKRVEKRDRNTRQANTKAMRKDYQRFIM
ncbi:hypothetical protein EDB86DRAFT_2824415 [Lactarius hatsudake]|nr:hypothetical protein EDB86DRAFT_2824415 [Lactarius hatsudake]